MTSLIPLGDQAVLAYFANEEQALQFAARAKRLPVSWLVDVVQAYTSVAVFFQLDAIAFPEVAEVLRQVAEEPRPDEVPLARVHQIPCCYEFALDMEHIRARTSLSCEEIIRLHQGTEYTVYAIGFCPGFPYLGYLPESLCGVPRLPSPRVRVEAGSVGLTGRQTGIYTEVRPGGWNLIGRTPLEMVNVCEGYFPLRTGDRVRFVRVDEREFERLRGERL